MAVFDLQLVKLHRSLIVFHGAFILHHQFFLIVQDLLGHGIARPGAIEIEEEKCLIVPVINVRNHQRSTEISADSVAPRGNFWRVGLGERIWARVEYRIAVLIVEAYPHSIDSLAQHALHAIKGRDALWRRAAASRPGSSSALRPKSDRRSATRTTA